LPISRPPSGSDRERGAPAVARTAVRNGSVTASARASSPVVTVRSWRSPARTLSSAARNATGFREADAPPAPFRRRRAVRPASMI
jgi:hypothetical protein